MLKVQAYPDHASMYPKVAEAVQVVNVVKVVDTVPGDPYLAGAPPSERSGSPYDRGGGGGIEDTNSGTCKCN